MTRAKLYDWIRAYLMELLSELASYKTAQQTTDSIIMRLDGWLVSDATPEANRKDPDVPYSLIDFLALCDGHELDDITDEMVVALFRVVYRSGDGGKAYCQRLARGERPQVGWVDEAFVRLALLEPR